MESGKRTLNKILSGGQAGADQGGLVGAVLCGIPTGGWAPKGYLTEKGCKPELLKKFGLVETASAKYPARTELNVMESDGTLLFAQNLKSVGTKLTLKNCRQHSKPYLFIPFPSGQEEKEPERIRLWIAKNDIRTLNVAGNRESVAPGIQQFTADLIVKTFKMEGC